MEPRRGAGRLTFMPRSMFMLPLAVLALGAVSCQGESNPGGPPIAVSTTTVPVTSVSTGTLPPPPPIVLSKSGGCGEAFFWAANGAGTIAVTATVDVRPRSQSAPTSIEFAVPDPKVKVEVQRGRNLTQPFCSDVITSEWHVDSRERATGGNGRIVVDPPLPAGHCGSKGRLHIGDLVTDAGTHFAALDVKTTSIGCYAG